MLYDTVYCIITAYYKIIKDNILYIMSIMLYIKIMEKEVKYVIFNKIDVK